MPTAKTPAELHPAQARSGQALTQRIPLTVGEERSMVTQPSASKGMHLVTDMAEWRRMTTNLPRALKDDAISEALVEVRFDSDLPAEVVTGRLADLPAFAGFTPQRLAIADVPDPIRQSDVNLRYRATLQLTSPEKSAARRISRVGPAVMSYHVLAPYPGWEALESELAGLFDQMLDKLGEINVVRLGLRYVNLIDAGRHHVRSFADLNVAVLVGERPFEDELSLTLQTRPNEHLVVNTRIATPAFVSGPRLPADFSLTIDVDVFDNIGGRYNSKDLAQWCAKAHDVEKQAFFETLPPALIEELRER